MPTLRALALSLLCATPALAQFTHVIPNGTATVAGNSSNAFPWGTAAATWGGLRLMAVYDSSNFTGATINGPIVITRLRWRANDSANTWTGGTFATGTVRLSTAAVDWAAVTTNYASNHGADLITAYTGPVTYQAGTGNGTGVPAPWVVDITLSSPFLYDPANGDLAIDCDYPGGTNFVGGSLSSMDIQSTGSMASRIYASSQYPNANGTTQNHGPVVEVSYLPSQNAATAQRYGAGCYTRPGSFYELFATAAAFDLANTSLTMIATGNGYVVVPGLTSYVAPTATATTLTLANNAEATVNLATPFAYPGGTTSALTVCSNGFISVASGNGTGAAPASGPFLVFPQACWAPSWHDYDTTVGGAIKFEQVGGLSIVTWEGVGSVGVAGSSSTFQVQFDRTSGSVHYVWGVMSNGGNGHLVGFKAAGIALDPGNVDLSATPPGTIQAGRDLLGLRLDASARPLINTSVNLVTTEFPATSALGALILSFTQHLTGLPLAGMGMPGCSQFVGLDVAFLLLPVQGSATFALAVPNDPALNGRHVFGQSAAFVPAVNPLGVLSSNGLDLRVGTQ